MRLSLVVTTYERPDALALVLATIARQRIAPDEVLIADDGSGPDTQRVIRDFAGRLQVPCHHVWQPHEGFGAGRVRNRAIAAASGDYVVLVDGDMLLHPQFIADHQLAAAPGCYVQGTRIRMDAARTARAFDGAVSLPGPLDRGIGGLRRCYAVRSRLASRALRRAANAFVAIKSCNQGFWRTDLLRVNGFDETMTGWGYEDKELCARLEYAGVRRLTLLLAGIAYHLHHPAADRTALGENRRIYERTRRERRVVTRRGISQNRARGQT